MYKHLEIDCDAVFKAMLLLKKKKYAARAATRVRGSADMKYTNEYKGLDIVRRDWSVLAKETGYNVVNMILTSECDHAQLVDNIHELLKQLATQVRDGQVPLNKFEITKQLTKNPEDYADKKSLSHVTVALRYNANQPQGRKLRSGDVVPYVVVQRASNPANYNVQPATQRVAHPDEVQAEPQGRC